MARILIISIVYPPDAVSTATITRGLAIGLRDIGHDVAVLTSVPHFNPPAEEQRPRRFQPIQEETTDGVRVFRGYVLRKSSSIAKRLLGLALLHAAMVMAVVRRLRDRQVVIVISPPLTFAVIGALAKVLGRGRLIYNAQELWPDVPRDLGVISNPVLLRLLGWFERQIYRRADHIVPIGGRFATTIVERGAPVGRVTTIENFVDTGWIVPRAKDNGLARRWGLTDRRVILYAGNLGLTQDFDLLLTAAEALEPAGFDLLIVGGGAARERLVREIGRRRPGNVRLENYLPERDVPDLYGLADVVAVPLKPGHDRSTTPSKIYSAMAAERPLVACTAPDTDLADAIKTARAGLVVPPGDASAFTAAVVALTGSKSGTQWDRAAARRTADAHSPSAVARQYADVIDAVALR